MQRQRIDTTRAIMMQTGEFQQVFEIGLNVGLCGGGCRFKLELPAYEESTVAIIRSPVGNRARGMVKRGIAATRHRTDRIGSFVEQGAQ
jgi:hypothetical protein